MIESPAYDMIKEEGIREGYLEKEIEIAKNMINKDYSVDQIAEITGLPKEKLEDMKRDIM